MRLGAKILLLMLTIVIGACAAITWIVTSSVTTYETRRVNDQISAAIARYVRHLDDRHEQISQIVRAMLEAPAQRSLLQAADEGSDEASREQLSQEVLGRDVRLELQSRDGSPAFQVLLNGAGEIIAAAPSDAVAAKIPFNQIRWDIDGVLGASGKRQVIQYIAAGDELFLAMGVPLRTQLSEAPNEALFVGFRVDDAWVRRQLLAEQATTDPATGSPLTAWFVVGDKVLARASSSSSDPRVAAFRADTPLRPAAGAGSGAGSGGGNGAGSAAVEFEAGGDHFLGQSFLLNPADPSAGRLVLASSLDQALGSLHRLQEKIALLAVVACAIAVAACKLLTRAITKPIDALLDGTRRIAAGQFDDPVHIKRRDELGMLGDSFNQMSQGLKERDSLREEKVKIERDLAVARKIQMDVLPKELPSCPGYDMAAFSLPAEATGGDIYDLLTIALEPPGPTDAAPMVLLLADATGHGIGPALSVTQVRSMLRIGIRLRAGLEDVFSQINRQLCQDLDAGRFVTAFIGFFDSTRHKIDYHSAGQAPLLHFHARTHRFEWLNSSMLPLGIDEDARSDGERSMLVEPGDLVVLLTDGFYECQDPEQGMFGRERIGEIILQHHHRPASELLAEILRGTQAFARGAPQVDDMTALIIRRLPA